MSSLKIKTNSRILANALAVWFESGEAMDAFLQSTQGAAALSLEPEIEDLDPMASMDFDESEYSVDHECEFVN